MRWSVTTGSDLALDAARDCWYLLLEMPGTANRRVAACTLAAVALTVAGTGCGGESAADRAAKEAQRQAQARWRAGLTRWSTQMIGALNEISVILSTADTVTLLERGNDRVHARLERFESTLASCGRVVRGLGPAPEVFAGARRDALRACSSLESGTELVRSGVLALQHGRGLGGINEGTVLLGVGQESVLRARAQLAAPVVE
jgi:hypothetical protein